MSLLANLIEQNTEALLRPWTERVDAALAPGAPSEAELRDHIPAFLRELVGVLRNGNPPALSPAGKEHGRQREQLGFRLDAVVREYGILRELVLDLIERHGTAIPLREIRVFSAFVSTAVADGVAEHERQRQRHAREATAREELERSKLRHVLEASGAGLWDLNPKTGEIASDARMVELMGLPAGTALTLASALQGVHPDDRAPVAQALTAALAGENGGRFHTEFRTGGSGGVPPRWVESRARIALGDDGQPIRLAGSALDITERKEAELAQARLLRSIADQSVFGVAVITGPELVFTVANAAYRQLAGNREMVGKPLLEALPEFAEQGVATSLLEIMRTGKAISGLETGYRMERHGGGEGSEQRYFNFIWYPLPGVAGAVDSVLVLTHDVTDGVQAKARLTRYAWEARERVEFEQQLIGIVSHDLRSPLSAILLGASTLARRESLDMRSLKTVVRLQSSAERAIRLVEDLLDFTQARLGGGLRIARKPTHLEAVARTVLNEVEASNPERAVTLSSEGDSHGNWDADRLAQVVQNLVTNALKYGPETAPVQLEIRGTEAEVSLSVHNSGPPIAADQIARVFQPMQRGVDAVDVTRSVGLGLFIVDQVMKAHGGTVELDSSAEKGTTFTVRLPRAPLP